MSAVTITPSRLAETLHSATPNLFGSILVRKQISLRKMFLVEAAEVVSGALYKEYSIKRFATIKDYKTAVNNAKERSEQERLFEVSERKWGEHWNGSFLIITHKGRFYLETRLTKQTIGKSRFIDSAGNVLSEDTLYPFLLARDRRDSKRKAIAATAARQGLTVECSVQIRDIPLDTIITLKYGGTEYSVIPEATGNVSEERSEDEPEEINA